MVGASSYRSGTVLKHVELSSAKDCEIEGNSNVLENGNCLFFRLPLFWSLKTGLRDLVLACRGFNFGIGVAWLLQPYPNKQRSCLGPSVWSPNLESLCIPSIDHVTIGAHIFKPTQTAMKRVRVQTVGKYFYS